jgi:hypothetical protein
MSQLKPESKESMTIKSMITSRKGLSIPLHSAGDPKGLPLVARKGGSNVQPIH